MAAANAPAKLRTRRASGRDADVQLPAVRVLRQFRQLFNSVKTHFQRVEQRAGLGGAQVWALSLVRDRPEIGVNDLASAMDIHQSTASNLVRTLVAKNLVAITRDTEDRRSVHLAIRKEGRALLRRAPGPFSGVLPEALAGLDRATLLRLDRDLTKLITALKSDRKAAQVPLGHLWTGKNPRSGR